VIFTQINKAAALLSAGTPNDEQLKKINALSKSPLAAEEVYCFSMRLCDNLPDRDFECFDERALPALAALFIGKTGICDHEWSANRQVARIFDTQVLRDGDLHFVQASAYMLRTDKNADLIAEIEGGIKKEVSVGCAMAEMTCSICGKPYGTCMHQKGVGYDGKICIAILSAPTDAYEFSFVAVPAQREAGVLKAMKGGLYMSLEEYVQKAGSPAQKEDYRALARDAALGRARREELVKEVVSMGLILDFGATETVLRAAAQALDHAQLSELHKAMEQKTAALFPPKSQLSASHAGEVLDSAFLI
jgi:hypothetical protein